MSSKANPLSLKPNHDHSRNHSISLTLEPKKGTRSQINSGPDCRANRIRILRCPRRARRMHGLRPQLEGRVPTIRHAGKIRSLARLRKRNSRPPIYPQLNPMNNYVFVLSSTVLSIAAFSYHEALEILVFSVGIDEARDYLFSELN